MQLGAYSVAGAAERRGQALLDTIPRYVGPSAERQQELEIAAGDDFLFFHSDAVVGRLVSLLGKRTEGAGAIAGMEAGEYWSLILWSCAPTLDDDHGVMSFMEHCSKRIGDTYFRTPRTTITAFINLLAVLEQNQGSACQELLGGIEVSADRGGTGDKAVEAEDGDEFASFKM